jgi:hypothetical protein
MTIAVVADGSGSMLSMSKINIEAALMNFFRDLPVLCDRYANLFFKRGFFSEVRILWRKNLVRSQVA